MGKKSLLTKEDIDILESWTDGYFYKIFYYLEDFVKKGIEQKLFTLEEAKEDLNIALWYAYAGNNIDIYEYYYKVINWMPYSEKNAKGSGAWYYRYSVALTYCSALEKAYSYAQKGVQEEADYPWGWLNLAKLQYHFGEKEKAMASIEKGLSLVPDDYEFKVLQEEIKANCSLEEMLCHYIKPEDDAFFKNRQMYKQHLKEKMQAVDGVICHEESLQKVKEFLKGNKWQENNPYCTCMVKLDDITVKIVFTMNRAMLSKINMDWLIKEYTDIKDNLLTYDKYDVEYKLQEIEIDRDYQIKLTYYNKKKKLSLVLAKDSNKKVQENHNEHLKNDKEVENLALTLYKRDEQFSYVECWFEDDKIVKHYGLVGDKGDIKKYENCSIDDYKLYLDIFVGRYEKLGYISWREFTKKTLLMKITIEDNEQNLWKEENEAPIYFLYEMVQKALEINVVGFLNDWGYRRNEKKNLYEIDFYFDTVDKDIAVNLVKHVIEVFSMNAKSKVEEVIELAEVKNGVV